MSKVSQTGKAKDVQELDLSASDASGSKNVEHVPTLGKIKDDQISVKKEAAGLKSLISKKKRRFQQDGYDLDLTYITDRIIAMGYPASSLEAVYRNNIDDVAGFLSMRHGKKYMVYNLCSEKAYDHNKFENRVVRFPFDDHNCPKFDDLEPFCEALDEWLSADPENIAAIHCKAGKGRTGLVICIYLLHTGMWERAEEALRFYGVSRTQNQKGVTIPSQRRWVKYYEQVMRLRRKGAMLPSSRWYKINRIVITSNAPQFRTCTVFNNDSKYVSSMQNNTVKKIDNGYECTFGDDSIVNKDIKVQFDGGKLRKARAFSFWFNTDFVENNYLKIEREEIDKVNKDKKSKDFYVEVYLDQIDKKSDEQLKEEQDSKVNESILLTMSSEDIVVLALRLQDSLVIRNRTWKDKVYEDCFTGTDAVRWLSKEGGLGTTKTVLDFGNLLMKESIIYRVKRGDNDLDEFVNGPFFYRFNTSPPE